MYVLPGVPEGGIFSKVLKIWEFLAHMSLWVQFAQFCWMFEVSAGTMQKGEIRFGSPAEG